MTLDLLPGVILTVKARKYDPEGNYIHDSLN